MAYIKIIRETDKYTFYGVFIKNYAEDQLDFLVFETICYDKAKACEDALIKNGINDRHAYNKSDKKRQFIRAGCSI